MINQKKRRTAGSVIASVLLSLLLILPFTLSVILCELRSILSENGIRYYLDEADLSRISISFSYPGKNETLLDQLAASLRESAGSELLTAEQLEKLIKHSTIKPFLAREIGEIIEDFKKGTSRASVTVEELAELVDDNWELLEKFLPESEKSEIGILADEAAAGRTDPSLLEAVREYRKQRTVPAMYTALLQTLDQSGGIKAGDRDLLLSFLQDELLPFLYKKQIAAALTEKMPAELNTAHLRSQLKSDEQKMVDMAFSRVPVYLLLAICALLCLLYGIADRHIPGDACIGIGALALTVFGPLAAAGLRYAAQGAAWLPLIQRDYLPAFLSGAFLGFHKTANLIGAAAGLGLLTIGIVLNAATRRKER